MLRLTENVDVRHFSAVSEKVSNSRRLEKELFGLSECA